MNEEDLVKLAGKAAGDPVDGVEDSDELAELEHAMAVLRGASVEPDKRRIRDLEESAADQRRMVRLWHFAAVAVVFFCIGLFTLLKIGLTPPDDLIPVANVEHNQPAPAGNKQPGRIAPANDTGPDQEVYVRPEWITSQVVEVANTSVSEGSGTEGGMDTGGGHTGGDQPVGGPPDGQLGHPPGHSRGNPPATPKLRKLLLPEPPEGMELKESRLVRKGASGAGFDLYRIEYRAADGGTLLLLEAIESGNSRAALDAAGLKGNAFTDVVDGTVVLLVSNTLDAGTLQRLAGLLAEPK